MYVCLGMEGVFFFFLSPCPLFISWRYQCLWLMCSFHPLVSSHIHLKNTHKHTVQTWYHHHRCAVTAVSGPMMTTHSAFSSKVYPCRAVGEWRRERECLATGERGDPWIVHGRILKCTVEKIVSCVVLGLCNVELIWGQVFLDVLTLEHCSFCDQCTCTAAACCFVSESCVSGEAVNVHLNIQYVLCLYRQTTFVHVFGFWLYVFWILIHV